MVCGQTNCLSIEHVVCKALCHSHSGFLGSAKLGFICMSREMSYPRVSLFESHISLQSYLNDVLAY